MKLYKGLVLVPVIVGILCGCINEVMIKESTPESNLEATWLREYLEGCMHTPDRLQRLSANMMGVARTDASSQLADLVEEVARG